MPENGRPSKLDPATTEKVVQAIIAGCSRADAARYAGVTDRTLQRWIERGRAEKEGPFAGFVGAILDAEAKASVLANGCIARAIRDGDWKAAAWFLERRFPERYAPRSRLFDPHRVLEILEERGLVVDRDRALVALAEASPGVAAPDGDDLGGLDVSEEDKKALFRVLRAARGRDVAPDGAIEVGGDHT
ncbi:MAG TPA: hypothetical protein VFY93_08310 [Planctomycetota bacterium]|nr:hypothetical protein [Planctomycetota bacterium]